MIAAGAVRAGPTAEDGAQAGAASRHAAIVGMLTRGPGVADRLPGLPALLEAMAKRCAAELTVIPPGAAEVRLVSLETGAVRDAAALEARGSLTATLRLDAWEKTVSVLADRDSVFAVVELLCGGDGAEPRFSAQRELTNIEKRISRLFFEKVATGLAAALAGLAETEVHVMAVGEKDALDALGRPAAAVVMAAFELSVLGRRGRFVLAMPEAALEPIRKELTRAGESAPRAGDLAWAAELEKEVTKAAVVLTVVLDELSMDLGDLARLAPGRILELRASPERPVKLEADGQPLLNCQLGKTKGFYTLRVEGFIDHEREFLKTLIGG
jgi:flagellar motor switch protein FliM